MRMNIYVTTSRKNLKYAYVAIKSLFVNNKERKIYLYIVSEDLTLTDIAKELELAKEYGHKIIILRFDEERASRNIHIGNKGHWPIGAMSSYWLFHDLLPEDVDRIMVIESDTVIIGNLSEIYDMDFEDNYVICPAPEHKPIRHREFMQSIGGDTLTFVLSIYNIPKIRRDFQLQDILLADEEIKKYSGYSQMEFTFGLLFKKHIKYVPGSISCIDENERYMEELGYDYIVNCEKTAKIIHFSSYGDYGKPWNPVSLMPGYIIWWQYAQGSPYYDEYFLEQWKLYDKVKNEKERMTRYISHKNILLCTLLFFCLFVIMMSLIIHRSFIQCFMYIAGMLVSVGASILLRRLKVWCEGIYHKV